MYYSKARQNTPRWRVAKTFRGQGERGGEKKMKTNNVPRVVPFPLEEKNPSFQQAFHSLNHVRKLNVDLWKDAVFVMGDIPVDPEEARKILPLFMKLDKPYKATFFFCKYPNNAFSGPYNETALLLHVRTPFGKGIHCPWMLLDDDTALIYGRELLGYPKKTADISFEDDGKKVRASATRRNIAVFEVEAERISQEKKPMPLMARRTFNIGGLGQFLCFNPIWMFSPTERIHESYSAKAILKVRNSDYDPISRLIADYSNPIDVRVAKLDLTGSRMLWPVGVSGLRVWKNSFNLRYR